QEWKGIPIGHVITDIDDGRRTNRGRQPAQHLALVDVQRRPQFPDHPASMESKLLAVGDPLQGRSEQCRGRRWVGRIPEMDTHAGALALDAYPRPASLHQPRNGKGGALQWLGKWLRRRQQPRFAVSLLQSVIADKDQAVDWQPRREGVGIPATDDGDPQQIMAELVEQGEHGWHWHRLVGIRHDRRERAIEVEAEQDARGRNPKKPVAKRAQAQRWRAPASSGNSVSGICSRLCTAASIREKITLTPARLMPCTVVSSRMSRMRSMSRREYRRRCVGVRSGAIRFSLS